MLRPASRRPSPARVQASKARFAWLLAAALVAGGPLSAAEPAGDASLDQSLLEQLTEGLGTPEAVPATKLEAGNAPAKAPADPIAKPSDSADPAAKKPTENGKPAETKPTEKPASAAEGLDGDLLKELTGGLDGATGEAAGDDAVAKIASRMASVKDRLARAEAGGETRTLQDEIVAELDRLLKLQKQNQKQDQQSGSKQKISSKQQSQKQKKPGEKQSGEQTAQNSPSGKQPQQGQEKDGDKPDGKSGKKPIDSDKNLENKNVADADPSLDALAQFMQAEWGHLPEKERNQVMQAFREKMLPQYDRLIRAYFEELARRGAQQ